MVKEIRDVEWNLQTSPPAIVRTLVDLMTAKYNTTILDNDSIRCIARDIGQKVPPKANAGFETQISMEVFQAAVTQGKNARCQDSTV
jgi:hypothetical protein